jgi:hypothetical protein
MGGIQALINFLAGGNSRFQLSGSNVINIPDTDNVTSNNMTNMRMSSYAFTGTGWDRVRGSKINKSAELTMTAGVAQSAWTPAAGKKFRLLGFILTIDTTDRVVIRDGTTSIIPLKLVANTPVAITLPLNGILSNAANNTLQIITDLANTIRITAIGTEE